MVVNLMADTVSCAEHCIGGKGGGEGGEGGKGDGL